MSDDSYRGPERRDESWWKHWATPAAVLLLVGTITWGVQLNVGFAALTATTASTQDRVLRTETVMQEIQVNISKAAVVLEQLAQQVKENRNDIKQGCK
jgi:hypothetical protein